MGDPAIDLHALRVRTLGHEELANELLALFRDDAPATFAAIRAASLAGDTDALRRGLHRLKGSARTVGANAMATLLATAETDAAAGRPIEFEVIASELGHCVESIQVRLDQQER